MPALRRYRNQRRAWHNAASSNGAWGRETVSAKILVPIMLVFGLLSLGWCSRSTSNPEPARVATETVIAVRSSEIAMPITATIADLEAQLNARVPMSFSSNAAQQAVCASGGRLRDFGCRFNGTVRRGPIRVTGSDDGVITLAMPISGAIESQNLPRRGGAPISASADVEARVRLEMADDWHPVAKVALSYSWTKAPGIEALGRRIDIGGTADPVLRQVIATVEAGVPRALETLQPRQRIEAAWGRAFAVIPLAPAASATPPAAWLRMTPQRLYFTNYTIAGGALALRIGAVALTETFVGTQPADPAPTPLPRRAPVPGGPPRFRAHVPVIADYPGLETLVGAALQQAESQPMMVRGVGAIYPEFDKVSIHATTGGRLAIGLTMRARTPRQWLNPSGTVWMTFRSFNAPGSQVIVIRDVKVTGIPDNASFRTLLAIARSRLVSRQIGRAMSQNFTAQYDRALAAANTALADKQLGEFRLSVKIDSVVNGTLRPLGQGLYLPVDAAGAATLRLAAPAG